MKPHRLGILVGTVSMCWACAESPAIRPLPVGAEQQSSRAESAYEVGKDHLRAGRNGLAIVYFEQALAADPSSVSALNAIGAAYDQLHKYEIAQGFYTAALKLDPNTADTWNNMAMSLRLAGAPEAARKFLAEALKLDPANRTINANMAELDGPAPPPPKLVAATAATDLFELASDVDEARPQLRRSGEQQYDLAIPVGMGAGRYDGRQDVVAAALRIDVERVVVPATSAEFVLSVPVGKVTATLLPPPKMETVAMVDTPTPETAAAAEVQASERRPSPQIELANGVGRRHMAARMRSFLGEHGVAVSNIGDARPFDRVATVVAYRQGWANAAEALARFLPCSVKIESDDTIGANIRVVLGRDLSAFDLQLEKLHADQG